MTLDELVEAVGKTVKGDAVLARRVLRAAIALMKEEIATEERAKIPGLGVFIRKEGKEPGTSRVIFRAAEKKPEGAESQPGRKAKSGKEIGA